MGTEDRTREELLDELKANPQVTFNDDGTRTVKLSEPVEYARGKMRVEEVTFRKPKGRDWRETDTQKGDLGKAFALAAALSNLPMVVFDEMDGDDALLCTMVAGSMGKK